MMSTKRQDVAAQREPKWAIAIKNFSPLWYVSEGWNGRKRRFANRKSKGSQYQWTQAYSV
jgi:hypothetical protein